ncbi:SPFH/Band 7/PHB domain protein [Candidatus Babeliales bacterium]|nr:SPFH/Band 7/PHB domain protein [Candidatus Babeliales bacterium]
MTPFVGGFYIVFVAIVLFLLIVLARATYLVRQAEIVIIERLGKFHTILESGLHFVIPFIDQTRKTFWTFIKESPQTGRTYRYTDMIERIDMREAVYDFPKQNVITRDNVTIEINALLYYQITDPKSAVYEVFNLPQAIEKLTQTTLRNVIGSMDLDETLVSRDLVNEKLRLILDDATDKWGVKVNRVELQEVNPPHDIRNSMEKQMRAERDRRALILEAEGAKRSAILQAEGYKEAQIARAEGEAQARIKVADAEAQAILLIQKSIPGADPLPFIIAKRYINVLPEIMKGKNDKLILMPYESSNLIGSLASIKEIFKNLDKEIKSGE